jgi:hypothetical protein
MKSRNREMNRPGSTCALEVSAESAGTGTAPGRARNDGKAGQTTLASPGSASLATARLTHEQVAERARALWLASGCLPGRDVQNWWEAEAQLRAELSS